MFRRPFFTIVLVFSLSDVSAEEAQITEEKLSTQPELTIETMGGIVEAKGREEWVRAEQQFLQEPANTGLASTVDGVTPSITDFLQRFLISVGGQEIGLAGEEELTFEYSDQLGLKNLALDLDYKFGLSLELSLIHI